MKVKICGITRLEDGLAAARLGAWAVGFVFWPGSPRAVSPDAARRIAAELPVGLTTVGVFVDQDVAYIEEVAAQVNLGAVQLHGRETPEQASALSRPVIKAIPIGPEGPTLPAEGWGSALLLLDTYDPVRHGGTGRPIDWAEAERLARRHRVMLAGGLSPDNVGEAVARVRPEAVDVSSGVETAPGVKDHARLRALFEALAGTAARERGR